MIYITRTRFLNVMISQYNDHFHGRLEVYFAINLRLLLTFCANDLSFYGIRASGVSKFCSSSQ